MGAVAVLWWCDPPSLARPELLAGDASALSQCLQLRPNNFLVANPRPNAAVGAGLYIFSADTLRVVDQTLGDQLRVLDKIGGVRNDAGHQHLARRQLYILPHVVLVLVPHVRRLDRVLRGVDLEHQIGDVLELDVMDVGPVTAPPAGVEADEVLWQACERVIQHLDAQAQVLTQIRDTPIRVKAPGGTELRLVDLDDQSRVCDGLVLLTAGLRHRRHILLFAVVVVVVRASTETYRPQSGDIPLDIFARDSRLQVGDVGLNHRLPCVGNRPDTGPLVGLAHVARRRKARPDWPSGTGKPQAGLVEAGEVTAVALCRASPLRRPGSVRWQDRVTSHTLLHVAAVAPGLGVIPIVDDVHAKPDLHVDDFLHCPRQPFAVSRACCGVYSCTAIDKRI